MVDVKTLVDKKLSEDTEFQATLADMSEEDQTQAVADKREELIASEFAKQEELASNQKIRDEKAEALEKQLKNQPEKKEEPETPKTPEMSLKDIRALQDVHDDDVDEVIEYAKFKGISVAEVKKSPVIQAHLRTREEERKTAAATNIGPSGKGSSKVTGDSWLDVAATENALPDSDEEMTKLSKAFVEKRSRKS